jgi:hypothetical protein
MTPELTAGLVCVFCGSDSYMYGSNEPCYNCGKGPEYCDHSELMKGTRSSVMVKLNARLGRTPAPEEHMEEIIRHSIMFHDEIQDSFNVSWKVEPYGHIRSEHWEVTTKGATRRDDIWMVTVHS